VNRAELRTAILEALGEASMCWSEIEKAGTFLSDQCIAIADRLVDRIPLQQPPSIVIVSDGFAYDSPRAQQVTAKKIVEESLK
jgi:hypothetical protein